MFMSSLEGMGYFWTQNQRLKFSPNLFVRFF